MEGEEAEYAAWAMPPPWPGLAEAAASRAAAVGSELLCWAAAAGAPGPMTWAVVAWGPWAVVLQGRGFAKGNRGPEERGGHMRPEVEAREPGGTDAVCAVTCADSSTCTSRTWQADCLRAHWHHTLIVTKRDPMQEPWIEDGGNYRVTEDLERCGQTHCTMAEDITVLYIIEDRHKGQRHVGTTKSNPGTHLRVY